MKTTDVIKRIPLGYKEVEGKKFYYYDFGSEIHGRISFRLWVHYKLVSFEKENPYLIFPVLNAKIEKGEKRKTLILRPGSCWISNVYVHCGYRGRGYFSVVGEEKDIKVFDYYYYRSPAGKLGISVGGLIQVPMEYKSITIKWKRDGRLYGSPSYGVIILDQQGNINNLEHVDLNEINKIKDIGEPK